MMKKLAICLIGFPGSGKTTRRAILIERLFADAPYTIISSDDMIEDAARATGKPYNEVFSLMIETSTKAMNERVQEASKAKATHIIWDQTNLSVKARRRMLANFPEKDYHRIALVVNVDVTVAAARNMLRPPGRRIPAHVYARMQAQYDPPTLEEGFQSIHNSVPLLCESLLTEGWKLPL